MHERQSKSIVSARLPLQRLGVGGFADLFGTRVDEIPEECRSLIEKHDFGYRTLDGEERDGVLLDVFKRIDSGELTVAGPEARGRWDKGWSENLEGFKRRGGDIAELVPKYIRLGQPLRLYQEYVMPSDNDFELNWYEVFRLWLLKTYFADAEPIYEFGSGSGFNLAAMAHLFPGKKLYGLDWSSASNRIADEMAAVFGWNVEGVAFDFFAPDETVRMPDGAAVLTIGALEQTGRNHEAFLQYLLDASPALCVHVEPIREWYDEDNLIDYGAIRFHQQRNYWQGFPDRLRELEREGRVEVLKAKRSFFGSLFIEGYSQLIWRPT